MDDSAAAIRRAAWDKAVGLYDWYRDLEDCAEGGIGGGGYRDPYARRELPTLRVQLDEVIRDHGFQGTYVDPTADYRINQFPWQADYPFCDNCELHSPDCECAAAEVVEAVDVP